MPSRPARPIRMLHLDDLVLLVAKCLSDFTHFVIYCSQLLLSSSTCAATPWATTCCPSLKTPRRSNGWPLTRLSTTSRCRSTGAMLWGQGLADITRRVIPTRLEPTCRMTKCVKMLRAKAKAKSMDQSQARIEIGDFCIRACDGSMLFAFAFARNTSTHFVIGRSASYDVASNM